MLAISRMIHANHNFKKGWLQMNKIVRGVWKSGNKISLMIALAQRFDLRGNLRGD